MPSFLVIAAVATSILAPTIIAVQPQIVRWSDKSHGPDGPWWAVTVEIGAPAQSIDLLPGGSWMTNIFGVDICASSENCPAEDAGLYDFLDSSSFVQIGATGASIKDEFNQHPGALSAVTKGEAGWVFDDVVIHAADGGAGYTNKIPMSTFSMIVFTKATKTLADGTPYQPTIGKLALGSPSKNQTWNNNGVLFNGTLLTSAVFEQGRSPSDSYSMHVGSVQMNIPGSLVLGGYYKDRAIGTFSIQPYAMDTLPIDLLDISIGVADGASPFNFTSKSGLLAAGNSTFDGAQQVTVDATQPYLYLPPTTCAAIAAYLPVTFEAKYGLYFWDTTVPEYRKILHSPAFLEFTFRESASVTSNMTVKVPFSLLNLTLSSPMTIKPRPYFPCFAGQDPTSRWSLGRAFMQAAFVGVKWEDGGGNWFLAQAPGPNTPKTASPLPMVDTLVSSASTWEDTWNGFWTVENELADDGTSGSSSTLDATSSKSGATSSKSDTITSTSDPSPKGAAATATIGSVKSSDTGADGVAGLSGSNGADGSDGQAGQDTSSNLPIAAIAGGAGGGVVVIGVLIFAIIFHRRRKAKRLAATAGELPVTENKDTEYFGFKAELAGEREVAEMEARYHGRFGQREGQAWKGNGYAHHGQGLGLGIGRGGEEVHEIGRGEIVHEMGRGEIVHEMGTERAPVEMYAPWSPKGI